MLIQVLCTLIALFAMVQCETIHFTNSPSHLMGSTNITSYKLLVNNSDPITIIEANKEIDERPFNRFHGDIYQPNDRIDVNIGDADEYPMVNDYQMKLVANLDASHQLETKKTHNIREAIGFTVTGGPTDESTAPLDEYKKSDEDIDDRDMNENVNVKKLVYSPVLLKKFIKEYTEKLKNADIGTKHAIQQIHEQIHDHQFDNIGNRDKIEMDKPEDGMEQKYSYNNFHDNLDENRHKPSDRYKDRDGWVTLEAVPWSSSSVSKWYPNGSGGGSSGGGGGHDEVEEDTRRRPIINSARPYSSKPSRFPYHEDRYHDEQVNEQNNNYNYKRPKPTYTDRDDRPGVYSTWTKPQSMDSNFNNNGRPRPRPYVFTETGSFNSHKYFDRNRSPSSSRPWQDTGDIITDSRPSSFPSESHSSNYHDEDRYNGAASNTHSSYEDRPNEGNGQWVLISTTKGYQIPGGNRRQHGKRALTLPPNQNASPVQSVRMHKAIKLTVLPANDDQSAKNSTFSTDSHKKPAVTTTTIHGGMVEIDASHDNIDDDVRATLLAQKKKQNNLNSNKTPSTTVNKTRRKLLKGNSKIEERSE